MARDMQWGIGPQAAKVVDDPRDDTKRAEPPVKPTKDDMEELAAWILGRTESWREHRRSNYEHMWDEYERLWRGIWSANEVQRKSERSTLIGPALGEAVENCVSEVEEALFGRGDAFDIRGEESDDPGMKMITDENKAKLKEDLDRVDFQPNVSEALVSGAVYGTAVGEIVVKSFVMRDIAASINAMDPSQPPEMQVIEKKVKYACLNAVHPRNFLIDPNAKTVEDGLGCAIEEYVGTHIVREGQEDGIYRKVDIGTDAGDQELIKDKQVESEYTADKTHVMRYYGLVPKRLLDKMPPDVGLDEQLVDLFPKEEEGPGSMTDNPSSTEPIDTTMVEAVVVLANKRIIIAADENPFLMRDRSVVAAQWDIVPGRFWGRGVCEKGSTPQKMLDAELRYRIDALRYAAAPMMAMDASRLPRGFKFEVYPGKSILTNGDPSEVLKPFQFGQLDQNTWQQAQALDQMVQRATGSLDVISLAQRGGDVRPGAMSMMLSGVVKRHKRTLMNFVSRFLIPALTKMMHRNMQFYPERYKPLNFTFAASGTMGIMQREYEMQGLVSLLSNMQPGTPEHKAVLSGVIQNTGLTNRTQLVDLLSQSAQVGMQPQQPDPMQAQLQQVTLQLELAEKEAKIALFNAQAAEAMAQAAENQAKARQLMLQPQIDAMQAATKGIYETPEGQMSAEFDRRVRIAELMLQEKDIDSNERIASMQSDATNSQTAADAAIRVGEAQADAMARDREAAAAENAALAQAAGTIAGSSGRII